MKANIKISLWIPLIFIVIMSVFLFPEFNALDIVMIIGVMIIVLYFLVGFIKRKDALVITDKMIKVTSPIKTKEFQIDDLSSLSLEDRGTVLRGVYQGEKVTLITNIYDEPLTSIKEYILSQFTHIKDDTT